MVETRWRPGVGAVADAAIRIRRDMIGRFAGRCDAVMAAGAGAQHLAVIDSCRCPGVGGVAGIAQGRRVDVVGRLAGCRGPVVTSGAAALHLRMVYSQRGRPGRGAVAGLASTGAGDVNCGFAGCRRAIVAAGTIADHSCMIEHGVGPGDRVVARAALRRRRYMSRRFAGGRDSIVTARTATEYLAMVNQTHRHPGGGDVAGFAHIRCVDVGGEFSGCTLSIVASGAVVDDARVIEGCAEPGTGGMAGVALRGRRNMGR